MGKDKGLISTWPGEEMLVIIGYLIKILILIWMLEIRELIQMEKKELDLLLLVTKLNSLDLLLENLKMREYFHFSKECLESLRKRIKVKAPIVAEFPNKQKLPALKALHSLLKSNVVLTAGVLKKL